MLRFLLSALYPALLLPWFLQWAEEESDAQIDKMQQKVHFTPGAEAPVPPAVALAGAALLSGHFLLGRLVRLAGWQALLSLLLGAVAGIGLLVAKEA
jgi:hypothetical protein